MIKFTRDNAIAARWSTSFAGVRPRVIARMSETFRLLPAILETRALEATLADCRAGCRSSSPEDEELHGKHRSCPGFGALDVKAFLAVF
jgi:hypothetical protein